MAHLIYLMEIDKTNIEQNLSQRTSSYTTFKLKKKGPLPSLLVKLIKREEALMHIKWTVLIYMTEQMWIYHELWTLQWRIGPELRTEVRVNKFTDWGEGDKRGWNA